MNHLKHLLENLIKSQKTSKKQSVILGLALLMTGAGAIDLEAVVAQIAPASDGVGTKVNPNGNRLDISGGRTSRDGANLFHSFQRFGLSEGQSANFLSNPAIRNILGRVVGGEASIINGLIQVSGGNSNLFLMNPAGIVFGPNAQLNVPASFTATTATGIGFNAGWFSAIADNNWTTLVGTPSAFQFGVSQPGAIANFGNLSIPAGNNLTLLGGTVLNAGTLSAPGGNITIAAVPGSTNVRISQPGHLLSLEVGSGIGKLGDNSANIYGIMPLFLPQLLAGGDSHATGVQVNADGTITLTNSGMSVDAKTGDAIASGKIDVSNRGIGGGINLIGERVGVLSANINASGETGGGVVRIGGNYQGKGNIPNALQTFVSGDSAINVDAIAHGNGGRAIVWADKTTAFYGNISARGGSNSGNGGFVEVSGKENLIFRGNVNLSAANGNLGSLLLDPENIVIVDGVGVDDSEFDDGSILWSDRPGETFTISKATLEAIAGDVTLEADNDITVDTGVSLTFPAFGGAIVFTADADNDNVGSFSMDATQTITAEGRNLTISGAGVTVGNINTSSTSVAGGSINLTATNGNISAGNLSSYSEPNDGGGVTLEATGDIVTGSIDSHSVMANGGQISLTSSGGRINTSSGNLISYSSEGNGGAVSLTAMGDIKTRYIDSSSDGNGNGGTIAINSTGGGIDISSGQLYSYSSDGNAGSVNLTATGDVRTSYIWSSSYGNGTGGNIAITSSSGGINISSGRLYSFSSGGNAGSLSLTASGDINTGQIDLSSYGSGNGGKIAINSSSGGINTSFGGLYSYSSGGNGGDVSLTASGNIKTQVISASSDSNGSGGNITINSNSGGIDTSSGWLYSYSSKGNAGAVSLTATGDIQTPGISSYSRGSGSGGNININSSSGGIKTSSGLLDASSNQGNAGFVSLTAKGDINTSDIRSYSWEPYSRSSGSGGNIDLTSISGRIDTGSLESYSSEGNAGSVNMAAFFDIKIRGIRSSSDGNGSGGNITINSSSGGIDNSSGWQGLSSSSYRGNGGDVSLEASADIKINGILSSSYGSGNGGNIAINSSSGGIDTSSFVGQLRSFSSQGNGGSVNLAASGNIKTNTIHSYSGGSGSGGTIAINSSGGGIDTAAGELDSYSSKGNAGSVNLAAFGDIQTHDIRSYSSGSGSGGTIKISSTQGSVNTTSGALFSASVNGTGGNVNLTAESMLSVGDISSSGLLQGGNITLTSNYSNVNTSSGTLDASSGQGIAGKIDIRAYAGSIAVGRFSGSKKIAVADGGTDDPLGSDPNAEISSDADKINPLSGEISLQAHNDITIDEPISTSLISRLELTAGRSININADIDTSGGNGDIALFANNTGADLSKRAAGAGSVIMAPGTTLNAGSGNISIELGRLAEIGNITLANLNTTSTVNVNAAGGSVVRSADSALITAGSAVFQTMDKGGLGTPSQPLRISVNNLEATTGYGGAFFDSPASGLTVGGADSLFKGISTSGGGDIALTAVGNIIVTEPLNTSAFGDAGQIALASSEGSINTTFSSLQSYSLQGSAGSVSIMAVGDIQTSNIHSYSEGSGSGGNITIHSTSGAINTLAGQLESSSQDGNGGSVSIEASGDIKTAFIRSYSYSGNGGDIIINSTGGVIDTSSSSLSSYSSKGNGGDVTITASGDIKTRDIELYSDSNGNAGSIAMTSSSGSIDTSSGRLGSYSFKGNGGSVNFTASGDIKTSSISSASDGSGTGGTITMNSSNGNIDTSSGLLSSYSQFGNGGDVNFAAFADIKTGQIRSHSWGGTGANITLISSSGNITSLNNHVSYSQQNALESFSALGTAGDVTVSAAGNVTIEGIRSDGDMRGGHINITSSNGAIATSAGALNSYSENGIAGNVILESKEQVTTAAIRTDGYSQGGDITITSHLSSIDTSGGNLDTHSTAGEAGIVTLNAYSNIATSSIRSDGQNKGGAINLTSQNGAIATSGTLDSYSSSGSAGNLNLSSPGSVAIAGDITTYGNTESGDVVITSSNNNVTTSAITTQSGTGPSGDIIINGNNIQAGNVRSIGTLGSGDINVTAPDGSVKTENIQTVTEKGDSGDIDVDAKEDIKTGDQTTSTGDGNSGNINNTTDGNQTTGDQTTSTGNGNSGSIDNNVGGNQTTGNQTTSTENGNSGSIDNNVGGNQTTGNQTTSTENGNSGSIDNNVGGNQTTGNQISQATGGNSSPISNTVSGNQTTGNQISQATGGNSNTIVNAVSGNQTTGNQISSATGDNSGSISNTVSGNQTTGNQISQATGGNSNTIVNAVSGNQTTGNQISSATGDNSGSISNTVSGNQTTGNQISQATGGNSGPISNIVSGNQTTGNQTSTTANGNTGAIANNAGNNQRIGNQTSTTANGNAGAIANNAGGNQTIGNQTSTTANGNTGAIANNAGGNQTIGNQTSTTANGNAGDILNISNGNQTIGNQTTSTRNGNSGNISNKAGDNQTSGNQTTSATNGNSGNISNIAGGNISTGTQISLASNGYSGNITNAAVGNITTGDIRSEGTTGAGNVTATSTAGGINTGNLESLSSSGNSGNLIVSTWNNITTGNINSVGGLNSGNISVISTQGKILTGDVLSQAISRRAGNLTFSAFGDINTGEVTSTGALGSGDISFTSQTGQINTGKVYTDTGTITLKDGVSDGKPLDENQSVSANQDVLSTLNLANPNVISAIAPTSLIEQIEQARGEEFSEYFGDEEMAKKPMTAADLRSSLKEIASITGLESAIVYVTAHSDQLEVVLFTAQGQPIRKTIPTASRETVIQLVREFRDRITDPRELHTSSYLKPAQQLYQWLIAPIESDLQANGINTVLFSMDNGLRSLPIAALHDGKQFLIEKYSLALIPSVSLMDTRYQSLKNSPLLAMGASQFADLEPLPGVPVELAAITQQRKGNAFLNETFTRKNLNDQRFKEFYEIIHFATHAEFSPGKVSNSYIQFWDEKLPLERVRSLKLNHPQVDLLVLSACRTAVGDEKAELGFAGFAVAAGVKSALASLWYVNDMGTLGLMNEFYDRLKSAPIKAEALREAQLAMIRGKVQIKGGMLHTSKDSTIIPLPEEIDKNESLDLSHPYYWSAFTMIGSPW